MLMFRPLMRYADFKGRARRAEYWLFVLLQNILLLTCVVLAVGSFRGSGALEVLGGLFGWLIVGGLLMVATALPYLAVLARRLHDAGLSAIWMILLAPIVASPWVSILSARAAAERMMTHRMAEVIDGGSGFAGGAPGPTEVMASDMQAAMMMSMVASLCSLALFVLTLLPGTRGPNRFGPDPRGRVGDTPDTATGDAGDRWDDLIAQAKREAATPAPAPIRSVYGAAAPTVFGRRRAL